MRPRGQVIKQKIIKRADVRAHRDVFYVFGDNMARCGLGGQAAEMRGEPNTIGIPTKWTPRQYFSDLDAKNVIVCDAIGSAFCRIEEALAAGHDVIWPEDGIGTGLADLERRAPKVWAMLENCIDRLMAHNYIGGTVESKRLL